MRNEFLSYILITALLLFSACQNKTRNADFLVLSTNEVKIDGSTKNSVEFSASILLESDETILEQGFTYAMHTKPNTEDNILKVSDINKSKFKIELDKTIRPDTTYYVRSFVRTNKHFIYGNEVLFYSNGSEPPFIETIQPNLAFWGDTIMVTGENFDETGKNNSVWFNEFKAPKTWGSKDTLFAIVPNELNSKKCELKVSLYGQQSENRKSFEILSPEIHNISKIEGQYPDTINIDGDNFNSMHLNLLLKNTKCKVLFASRNKLSFVVPYLGMGGDYILQLNQLEEPTTITEKFKYNEQIIYGIPEEGVYYGEPVVIKSKNLDFRKLNLNVRFNDDFILWSNQVKRYQDSIVFTIKSDYYSFSKKNTYQLLEGDYNQYDDIFSESFSFMDPLIELGDHETIINGSMQLMTKGRAKKGEFQLEGPLSITDDFYLTYDDTWRMEFDLLPGVYKFYYQDEITEKTYIGDIKVLLPQINELNNPLLRRGYYNYVNVEGVNLPLAKEYRASNCRVKHLESNRIFDFKDASLESCQIDPRWIVGRGDYELYIEIRGQKVSNSIRFSLEDDFEFERKIDNTYFSGATGSKIIQNGNKIIISRGYDSILYDLDANTYVVLSRLDQTIDNFIYHEGQFWGLTIYGHLYVLDEQLKEWQEITPSESETWINAVFTQNEKLLVIYKNGKVFEGIGKNFNYSNQIPAYQWALNAFLYNDELFVLTKNDFLIYNPETMNLKNEVPGYAYGGGHGWRSSIRFGNLISLVYYYQNEYVLFNLETKQFVRPEINLLPNGTSFFSNEPGDLFLMYGEYIYKYNPQ